MNLKWISPLNRGPLRDEKGNLIWDEEYVKYVEHLDDQILFRDGYIPEVLYINEASDEADQKGKLDRIFVKRRAAYDGFNYKNDSYSEDPDYSCHVRISEIKALKEEKHASRHQLHFVFENTSYEELGFKTMDDLKVYSLADIDLSYDTGLGSIINRIELAGINEYGKQDLLVGGPRVNYKFHYFNKHRPWNRPNYKGEDGLYKRRERYLSYFNEDDGLTHWVFVVEDRYLGDKGYIRIPYSFMIPQKDQITLKPICEMWKGEISKDELG